ncbi:hypothetical protein LWM68_05910 [Niabella sp. W65]|nr:hypothetical protein [Niabella sp. W65]MCH7362335.1 hypothetical protein [Niabella sp. W65]
MRKIIFSVALLFFVTAAIAQHHTQIIAGKAQAVQPRLVEWRRHIHQNPELSNREFKTQQYVLQHLKKLGIQADTLAKTGVVGILKGGKPGPVIALRADMDALPFWKEMSLLINQPRKVSTWEKKCR